MSSSVSLLLSSSPEPDPQLVSRAEDHQGAQQETGILVMLFMRSGRAGQGQRAQWCHNSISAHITALVRHMGLGAVETGPGAHWVQVGWWPARRQAQTGRALDRLAVR